LRAGVEAKGDTTSGNKDDAFGKGTSENDAVPTIVSGSIPPNKSDLTNFGVLTENGPGGGYLALFWSRVQEPSGTTNMDFELNRIYCDPVHPTDTTCADNGKGKRVTPLRSAGDKLIGYDLSNGGTTPIITLRNWNGSSWDAPVMISEGTNPDAIGAVNTAAITAGNSGGIGALDPYTFGEAVISFEALFGETCGRFGSAYLKSRSSDSFNAEIKDFVAPEQVQISNCLATISTEQRFYPNDSATISATDSTPQGTVTFQLFGPDDLGCDGPVIYSAANVALDINGTAATSNTNVAVKDSGTYSWKVTYNGGGDGKHDAVPGTCGSETFTLGVNNG
jgi:hypothetical protein